MYLVVEYEYNYSLFPTKEVLMSFLAYLFFGLVLSAAVAIVLGVAAVLIVGFSNICDRHHNAKRRSDGLPEDPPLLYGVGVAMLGGVPTPEPSETQAATAPAPTPTRPKRSLWSLRSRRQIPQRNEDDPDLMAQVAVRARQLRRQLH